eukprot:CAMPEP_0198697066 /NCGR_PEP_ID=MMETSP1468-20131203/317132_1 /TAXON_ID=1461545 /ORGANISM="Mantoniella sp, Strain CCMP1436" /LENGTH=73 /DNA_ID=CAMNT_0044453607 /DNA_START=281 /DNA_END=499 /DNA_ORIENTATION=-
MNCRHQTGELMNRSECVSEGPDAKVKRGRPRGAARDAVVGAKASHTAAGARDIGLRTPVAANSKGAQMLRAMG